MSGGYINEDGTWSRELKTQIPKEHIIASQLEIKKPINLHKPQVKVTEKTTEVITEGK
jgi:hypothetical protein